MLTDSNASNEVLHGWLDFMVIVLPQWLLFECGEEGGSRRRRTLRTASPSPALCAAPLEVSHVGKIVPHVDTHSRVGVGGGSNEGFNLAVHSICARELSSGMVGDQLYPV